MKKPPNKVALAMWILAGILLITEFWVFARTYEISSHSSTPQDVLHFAWSVWEFARNGFFSAGVLVAFGAIIELLDQIRWGALSAESKAAELRHPSLWHIVRRWPHSTAE